MYQEILHCAADADRMAIHASGRDILYPYTAERRDVLENTLPEAQEISQGRGFCIPLLVVIGSGFKWFVLVGSRR